MHNYKDTCNRLLALLPERTRDIVSRRFGVGKKERETLEEIGKKYKITRERVRQIEKEGIRKVKKKLTEYGDALNSLEEKLDYFGGIKKEDLFINEIIQKDCSRGCVVFLLHINENLSRFPENKEMHALWAKDKKSLSLAKKEIDESIKILKKAKKPLSFDDLRGKRKIPGEKFSSYLEVSKKVICNTDGYFGISSWPEINPKGIKDKAYIALKKAKKPLHFREVASILGDSVNVQTTHNELIKDPRFVLIGRGVYALSEWGYIPGEVKEVIRSILMERGAMQKGDIITHVAKQRIVRKNTIIQNLSNKKYFIRTPDGKYTLA